MAIGDFTVKILGACPSGDHVTLELTVETAQGLRTSDPRRDKKAALCRGQGGFCNFIDQPVHAARELRESGRL